MTTTGIIAWAGAALFAMLLCYLTGRAHGARAEYRRLAAEADHPGIPIADIGVVIDHNFGEVRASLRAWIDRGPGIRTGLQPIAAFRLSDGQPLPITVIPLRYRNNTRSRLLIRLGLLAAPDWQAPSPPLPAEETPEPDPPGTRQAPKTEGKTPA